MLINNELLYEQIKKEKLEIDELIKESLIIDVFTKDFSYRFCWSSNALEGNTLSLDDTISLIDYDEVRSGHTYTEYQEAKLLYKGIQKMLLPFKKNVITEEWIKKANAYVLGTDGEYRKEDVYIGSLMEAVYYPPEYYYVPERIERFLEHVNTQWENIEEVFTNIAEQHIKFERIHPFIDGNGRVGRMIVNQQLINNGYLPISINPGGKYRQAFRRYDRQNDCSLLTHLLLKAEIESFQRIQNLRKKLIADRKSARIR